MTTSNAAFLSPEESLLFSIYYSGMRDRALRVINSLHIPDIICNAEKPLSIEEIAVKSECDSSERLYPLMRLMAVWGIGIELENKHFTKNKTLELLRRDQGPSIGHWFEYVYGDECYASAKSLTACVKHGKPAFVLEHGMTHTQYMSDIANSPYSPDKMYQGASKYKIGSDERRRELSEIFSKVMQYRNSVFANPNTKNIFTSFPWSECKKIVDIGGSTGDFLASILKLPGCENIQGYVADLPEVIVEAKEKFHELGLPETRMKFIGQNILQPFSSELKLDVDTAVIKDVLFHFVTFKEKLATVLANCTSLFPAQGGKLLAIEYTTPGFNDDQEDNKQNRAGLSELDVCSRNLHYLNVVGAHLPFKDEWMKMLSDAGNNLGYKVHKVHDTFVGGFTIFELHYKPM